jgi:hypothetical protein
MITTAITFACVGFIVGALVTEWLDQVEITALDAALTKREAELDELMEKARDVRIALNGGFDDADADADAARFNANADAR